MFYKIVKGILINKDDLGERCSNMRAKPNLALLLVIISVALVGALAVSGILSTSRTIGSSGTVKAINVEVYWDSECTQVVSEVDWGFCDPGSTIDKTVYIKNTGNAPLALSMTYSGWSPTEASDYISLSWDSEGAEIAAGSVKTAVLTLSISETITGIMDFSFNIVIEGTG
jgi:hypothetical protein